MTGQLIKKARASAGLTQRELAQRLGTHQPVIARWENETTRPDFDTVVKTVEACGFDLHVELRPVDHDTVLVRRELAKRPTERLTDLVNAVTAFEAMSAAVSD
jgi:transcriptional regulator with XRE-family HTH domain